MVTNTRVPHALLAGVLLCLSVGAAYTQQDPPPSQKKAEQQTKPDTKPKIEEQDPATSQEQKKEGEFKQGETILKLPTEVVTVTVTVTDSYNRLVTGLDQQHFEVFEDKVKQKIEFFNDVDAPVSVGIIFDVSGSMKGKLSRALDALKAFVKTSHNDDDFFLVGFNQRANLLAEFSDGDALMSKLTLVESKGQTALYDAAYLGLEKVKQGRHEKRVLLLISDGQDNSSRYTYGELRKILKEAGVQIYSIGIVEAGGGAGGTLDLQGQGILQEISNVTGGKAFFPRSGLELEDTTTRIALELRHQYSIGYSPTNVDRNGKWRKVKVDLKPPRGLGHLTTHYKDGYYAIPQQVK